MYTYTEWKVLLWYDNVAITVEESLWPEIFWIAPGLVHIYCVEIHNEHRILKEITIARLL